MLRSWPTQALAFVIAHAAAATSFIPFAGVEELAPRPLHEFCGESIGSGKLRRCSHSVRKLLDDDGEVQLEWELDADPDQILSLDTEAARGVSLTKCGPNEIEVEMPEAFASKYVQVGAHVVGSRFVHRCAHLEGKNLFHRVEAVSSTEKTAGSTDAVPMQRVTLATTELPDLSHVFPYVSYHFSYMPAEARDVRAYPPMRTDFGQAGFPAAMAVEQAANSRRLGTVDSDYDFGGLRSGYGSSMNSNGEGWLHSLRPKQVSNFGWNWDFFMNCTEEPEFNYTAPGFDGFMKLKQPFVQVHAGLFLNFTSTLGSLLSTPDVQWSAGFSGHGQVSARMIIELETTGEAAQDPLQLVNMPMLAELEQTQWFEKIDLAVGTMPITVEPGFQMRGELYHKGVFNGTLQAGGKAHVEMQPWVEYSSDLGFEAKFEVSMEDVDLWPPLWLIETDDFEMGMVFQPQFFLRGQVTTVEEDMMAFEARPYMNVSLNRGGLEDDETSVNTLVVYPVRVIGLDSNVDKEYKVEVDCSPFGGTKVSTSPEPNWGQVEFTDPVQGFECSKGVPKMSMITTPITVSLIELDTTVNPPSQTTLGQAQVKCTSLVRGVCQQDPQVPSFNANGRNIFMQMNIIWEDDYVSWFAEQLKNIVISVDTVSLQAEALTTVDASVTNEDMQLRISHAGRTQVIDLSGTPGDLKGNYVVEFGTAFMQTWESCDAVVDCQPGTAELYYKGSQLCKGVLPGMPKKHISTKLLNEVATIGGHNVMGIPDKESVQFALFGEDQSIPLAVVNLFATVTTPSLASMFLDPFGPTFVAPSSSVDLKWTVAASDPTVAYTFLLTPMKLLPASTPLQSTYPSVNGRMLEPVGNSQTLAMNCEYPAVASVDAAEQPCEFSRNDFSFEGFALGDSVVVMIQWSSTTDGGTHVMYSPPFFISTNPGASNPSPTFSPRRLWTAADWNERLAQSTMEACEDKDLNFAIGAGLLIGGKMVDAGGSPNAIVGQSAPELSTGLRTVFALNPEAKAEDMLPDELCSDGVCSGVLPTCTQANFQSRHFPRLEFHMNRQFLFDDNETTESTIKTTLAYAFSVLPEAVEIMLLGNSTLPFGSGEGESGTVTRPGGNLVAGQTFVPTAQAQAPTLQWQSPYVSGGHSVPTRRLVANQWGVQMTFRDGLPYRVDRPLVAMMLRHGMFAEIYDNLQESLGPVFVQGFEVDEGYTQVRPTQRYAERLERDHFISSVVAIGGVSTAMLIAIFFLRQRCNPIMSKGARFSQVEQGREEDEGGLE